MVKVEFKLDWCDFAAAKHAVMKWHYSQRMPAGKLIKIGVWENGKFIGCVLFGRGAINNIGSPYDLNQTQVCELVRVALSDHRTPTSRIVAIAIKMLKRQSPGLRLVVSYADSGQGHHGGIYQAGGWVYVCNSQATSVLLHGKLWHSRSVGMKYGTHKLDWLRKNVDPRAQLVADSLKYKYLMPLDLEMRNKVNALAKKYPKRVGSDTSDTLATHAREGGAAPTPTLL